MTVKYVLIKQLSELTISDRATVGGKASSLGELMHAGFDVPSGFGNAGVVRRV